MKKTFMVLMAAALGVMTVSSGCDRSEVPSPASASQPVVKLRVAGFKAGSEIGAIPALNDRFMEENKTIKVVYEGMPGIQFKKYIKSRFAVNDAPDVIMLHPGLEEVGGYSRSGLIEDLSDEPWVGDFTPSALKSVSIDGKVYGTPNDLVVLGVYYNKDLFESLSLKTPTNWEEFLDVCEKLKKDGITPISIGNNDGWMTLAALFAMGSSLLKDPDFDRKLNERAIKFNGTWNDMVERWYALNDRGYLTPNSAVVSQDQAQKDFLDGKAGMFINGSWALAGLRKGNPGIRLGMFAMPANPPGEDTVVTASVGTMWAINGKTKQMAAAKKYLEFWSTEQTLQEWTKSQASFLTLQGADSGVPPELGDISRALRTSRTGEFLSSWWEQSGSVVPEMMDSVQGVYLKALTIDEMLTNMDNTWDKSAAQGRDAP